MNKVASLSSHPRRLPARLSVSSHHDGTSTKSTKGDEFGSQHGIDTPSKVSFSQSCNNSNGNADSPGMTVEKWFDRSNRQPEIGVRKSFDDEEPPYLIRQNSSSNLSESNEPGQNHVNLSRLIPGSAPIVDNGSSADDYRSVIDDLTIENKKLRKRLRKYEASYSPHLDKDRLFEVKIHGLPSRKRRELEETLRTFASTVNSSTDGNGSYRGSHNAQKSNLLLYPSMIRSGSGDSTSKNPSCSSTSNSRPVDSAYASMSNSGPVSKSTSNHFGIDIHNTKSSKDHKIQSFLHDIPKGLLPKHSVVMTERQKKKLVVRRLEQLFTGKVIGIVGDHSQPLQQQEVSKSAAKADRKDITLPALTEGVREAHIIEKHMDLDNHLPKPFANEASTHSKILLECYNRNKPIARSPEQRPTRPLDLDPDRAQVPQENVEYIRHLGLSPPQLLTEDSGDAESDAHGWIYLNLLISMAQLHIINVTPDFVRSAVIDLSSRFQLSRDGRKIRWRGGTEGTRLSSDSGASTERSHSQDSDSVDEHSSKKRKLVRASKEHITEGQFLSEPKLLISNPAATHMHADSFHYKPIFKHRNSEEESLLSLDGDDLNESYARDDSSPSLPQSQKWTRRSRSGSGGKRKRDDGPIVFYSGAKFCTDLSGDRGNISIPLHPTSVGQDGFSNHTQDAIGCSSRRISGALNRTTSGSLLSFRPFKDNSCVPKWYQPEQPRTKAPRLAQGGGDEESMNGIEWSPLTTCPTHDLPELDACGLGGTKPADHFVVTVATRRTKLDPATNVKLSEFSAPGPQTKPFIRRVSCKYHEELNSPEHSNIAAKLAYLKAIASPQPQSQNHQSMYLNRGYLVKSEVLSAKIEHLTPSALPAATAWYADMSSEEWESDCVSSISGVSHLKCATENASPDLSSAGVGVDESVASDLSMSMNIANNVGEEETGKESSMEDNDEDSDVSIDMLAHARKVDPETIAKKEQEFEMEVDCHVLA
ncbi:frequency clock protein [Tricladium varicosporioides]|nr:frequency clock protein [Hymenoscyphus varicosporioides]